MGLYETWCDATKNKDKRKHYWTYVEKGGGRDEIRDALAETIRSHYDRLERIAEVALSIATASALVQPPSPRTGRDGTAPSVAAGAAHPRMGRVG